MPRFHVAKDVDILMLPSMIIQIPVENALKHAFVGMEELGRDACFCWMLNIWVEDAMLR